MTGAANQAAGQRSAGSGQVTAVTNQGKGQRSGTQILLLLLRLRQCCSHLVLMKSVSTVLELGTLPLFIRSKTFNLYILKYMYVTQKKRKLIVRCMCLGPGHRGSEWGGPTVRPDRTDAGVGPTGV